jgi:hypothetical protein
MEKRVFEYKSEVLTTNVKWGLKDSASQTDVTNLDNLIHQRIAEGWEFVTYSYMVNVVAPKSAILVTFRKPK